MVQNSREQKQERESQKVMFFFEGLPGHVE